MLAVIPKGDLRWSLSLSIKTVQKRMRVIEKERESTLGCRRSNNTWIENQVRLLRPYSRYKSSLYTTEAATHKAINRRYKHAYNPGYKLLGQGG